MLRNTARYPSSAPSRRVVPTSAMVGPGRKGSRPSGLGTRYFAVIFIFFGSKKTVRTYSFIRRTSGRHSVVLVALAYSIHSSDVYFLPRGLAACHGAMTGLTRRPRRGQ